MGIPKPQDPFDQLDDPDALRNNPKVLKVVRGGPKSRELSLRLDYAFNVSSLDDIKSAYERFAAATRDPAAKARRIKGKG